MEIDGLVDREKLLDICGRNRKFQMVLVEKWGIKDYLLLVGGCKLIEFNYFIRLKEIIDRKGDVIEKDLDLLRYGRYFVIENNIKIIVFRINEEG